MSFVLDASAVLACMRGEPGAGVVAEAMQSPTFCGAANWAEVLQKMRQAGLGSPYHQSVLLTAGLEVMPVTIEDAHWAAERWRPGELLSLADRLCMALGERLDAQILTADRAWGTEGRIVQIR